MANYNPEWEELGRNIQDIVDRAVSAHDFQKLNQTIRQTVEKAVGVGTDAVRKATTAQSPQQEVKQGEVVRKRDLAALYGNTNGKTAKAILKIVGGGLVTGFSLIILFSSLVLDVLVSGAVSITAPIVLTLAGMAGGGALIGGGVSNVQRIGRFKAYRKALGEKTHCTLEKLARTVGKNVKFVRKELLKMIDEGLFLEGHLDHEQRHLITSDETFRHYEQSRLQLEERQRQAAAELASKAQNPRDERVREVLDKGNAFIAEIRRCNDAIPGEDISAKIYHMEMIVQRIFQRVEIHPEIVPDLKKLMDYYLPMTVKLLNAYADMDAQPVQGETILASKKEIEGTLDTLNAAFEKLLDELFADTAMDISSDISVLQTLLAQEGLTEDGLTKMKKQQNL